jgi:hypothetical protein
MGARLRWVAGAWRRGSSGVGIKGSLRWALEKISREHKTAQEKDVSEKRKILCAKGHVVVDSTKGRCYFAAAERPEGDRVAVKKPFL